MDKTIEIECTANIYIDEYVSEISDDVLIEEIIDRFTKLKNTKQKNIFLGVLMGDIDIVVAIISESKKLSIVDADKLKNFLNNL
jgi:hypothetical protein